MMRTEDILHILNANKHRFDSVHWSGATPRELEWRDDNLAFSLYAKNPLSCTWKQIGSILTQQEAQAIAMCYVTEQGITEYEASTLAKYAQARKILIVAEDLEGLADGMKAAIKQGNEEIAIQLAKRAAHKALVLLECKKAVEKIFDPNRFRWIKLLEAKQEEMPGNGELVQVLVRADDPRVDRWICILATFRSDEKEKSFFQKCFSWAVVDMIMAHPDKYGFILNSPDTAINNVEYYRRLSWSDMPVFEPRKGVKL